MATDEVTYLTELVHEADGVVKSCGLGYLIAHKTHLEPPKLSSAPC